MRLCAWILFSVHRVFVTRVDVFKGSGNSALNGVVLRGCSSRQSREPWGGGSARRGSARFGSAWLGSHCQPVGPERAGHPGGMPWATHGGDPLLWSFFFTYKAANQATLLGRYKLKAVSRIFNWNVLLNGYLMWTIMEAAREVVDGIVRR